MPGQPLTCGPKVDAMQVDLYLGGAIGEWALNEIGAANPDVQRVVSRDESTSERAGALQISESEICPSACGVLTPTRIPMLAETTASSRKGSHSSVVGTRSAENKTAPAPPTPIKVNNTLFRRSLFAAIICFCREIRDSESQRSGVIRGKSRRARLADTN